MIIDDNELLHLDIAQVTPKGLFFEGKTYTNSNMIKKKWFEHALREGTWQIPILFLRPNLDFLLIFDSGTYVIATPVEINQSPPEIINIYQEKLRALKEQFFEKNKKH
ncbi:hypothetical protein [Paenibacillus sp. P36]|uniref:hypothetical protein n=1 Tax=Paenibacillus sp. P36 TaxID=3342538 RepID=UPI0038B27DD4